LGDFNGIDAVGWANCLSLQGCYAPVLDHITCETAYGGIGMSAVLGMHAHALYMEALGAAFFTGYVHNSVIEGMFSYGVWTQGYVGDYTDRTRISNLLYQETSEGIHFDGYLQGLIVKNRSSGPEDVPADVWGTISCEPAYVEKCYGTGVNGATIPTMVRGGNIFTTSGNTGSYIAIRVIAGTPSDSSCGSNSGTIAFDSVNNRFYVRGTSSWKYVTMS
jgi:hypothetical protein